MARKKRFQPIEPFEITQTIEEMAFLGEGFVRHEGEPVFIPQTIPGEEVTATVWRKHRHYLEADLKAVTKPSPQRVTPPCPYFGPCTGCQWQHIAYAHQLEIKTRMVADHLRRVGGFEQAPVTPAIGFDDPWHYRNHARFTIGRDGQVGFVNRSRRTFVRIERCMIMDEGINRILGQLQDRCAETTQLSVRYGVHTGSYLIQPRLKSPAIGLDTGQTHYEEELLGRRFRIASPSFFQVNIRQMERLAEVVGQGLRLTGGEALVDAYAGVGTFAVLLASSVRQVYAIEESSAAIEDFRINMAGIPNISLIEGRTEDMLGALPERPDAVILDPPRAGCHASALKALCALGPMRVVYVSCDPASLARDLKVLVQGGYTLAGVQPIDMFPHTYHIEAVATLTKR